MSTKGEPHAFVIFGATGDLTRRKLLSAFWGLCRRNMVPSSSFILGVGRREMTDSEFETFCDEALREDGMEETTICPGLHYQALPEDNNYNALAKRLTELEKDYKTPGNRIFYLALPANQFGNTISALGEAGLHRSSGWTRLVIEKPFGTDLNTANELREITRRHFKESQVYLIDHYLGKETVQNLLVFRFANLIFESLWNRDRIDNVQITVAESLGLEGRAGYYENAGALRDMIQNHISQVLSVVAMESPSSYNAEAIRFEKTKLLRSVKPITPEDACFGQYTRGTLNGKEVCGYKEEPGVHAKSITETFAALRLEVANWRWQGVPFYIRTGKRLEKRISQICVAFKEPPACLFDSLGLPVLPANVLRITLQPNEGFALNFNVKAPGTAQLELKSLPLHFEYKEAFGKLADAYETLLFDVMIGDQSLFAHTDAVETSWKLYEPLLTGKVPVHPYQAGSWGPPEADALLRSNHKWLTP